MKGNYIYNIIYRLSICILPLVITPFSARVLGAEGVGLYSLSSAVACYFIMFGRLGLEHYGSRTIAVCKGDPQKMRRTFWSIYSMQCMTAVASCLLYILVIHLAFPGDILIYWMQGLYVLSALFDISWYFFGTEQFRTTTLRSLFIRGLIIAGMFLFVHTRDDLWLYTLIMSACFLLEQLLLFPFLFRQIKPIRVSWQEIKVHIKPNLKLFLPLAALSIYNWMDKLMLGLICGNEPVAFYNYADSIINLPKGIVAALGTVMLPRLSRLAQKKDYAALSQTLRTSMRLIMLICCALCFGIAGVAPVFVPFFLGPGYSETVMLTIYLALVMIPMSIIDVIQTQYLIPFGKENVYLRSVLLGAGVNLLLNALFIPIMQSTGAVIGTFGAQLAVCIYQLIHIRSIYPLRQLYTAIWPFFLCGMAEFGIAWFLGNLGLSPLLSLVIQVCSAGFVYLLLSFVMVKFVQKDLDNMLTLFAPRDCASS